MKNSNYAATIIFGAMLCNMTTVSANNTGVIHFIGSVTDVTCNYKLTDSNGISIPAVNLGTVTTAVLNATKTSQAVDFKLMPDNTVSSCVTVGAKKIDISISPATLNLAGISNEGTSTNTAIRMQVEGQTAYEEINVNNITVRDVKYDATDASLSFKAAMIPFGTNNATAGSVIGSALFAISYR